MRKPNQRRSREQWASIIENQVASELTIAAYCLANNVSLASFGKWKRRLRDEAAQPLHSEKNIKGFEPVHLIEPQGSSAPIPTSVTLSLGASITLTIHSCATTA